MTTDQTNTTRRPTAPSIFQNLYTHRLYIGKLRFDKMTTLPVPFLHLFGYQIYSNTNQNGIDIA